MTRPGILKSQPRTGHTRGRRNRNSTIMLPPTLAQARATGTRHIRRKSVTGRMGLGFGRLSGRTGAMRGWLAGVEDWLVVGRPRLCSLGGSVGSGRLRGSDGPDRACLARLGSACDCVCLECVCVGRSPLKDRLQLTSRGPMRACVSPACAWWAHGGGAPTRWATESGTAWEEPGCSRRATGRCERPAPPSISPRRGE